MPQQPDLEIESKESLPASEYTFCNNGKILETFLAPTMEVALQEFEIRTGREFSSVAGDSFSSIPTTDMNYLEKN